MQVWPATPEELIADQHRLAALRPEPWRAADLSTLRIGAAWVCFARGASGPGAAGDPAWAAAVTMLGRRLIGHATVAGQAGGPYLPGLLALRIGPLLSEVVGRLAERPDVLLIDATGRDHPRRAGLAVHLGAMLDLPTVGITHRPLVACGAWPDDVAGARAALTLDGEAVGYWLRTRVGRRPVAVHSGWRVDAETAVAVASSCTGRTRTPTPLREARRRARRARTGDGERSQRAGAYDGAPARGNGG